MTSEKTLRLKLGLTQQEMGFLTGVTRAHWGMAESGRRMLPWSCGPFVRELEQLDIVGSTVGESPEDDTALIRWCRTRMADIDHELYALKKEIDKGKSGLAEYEKRMGFVKAVRGSSKPPIFGGEKLESVLTRASETPKVSRLDVRKMELRREILESERKLLSEKAGSGV